MEFSLTEEIASQIIFAMENQKHVFYVQLRTGALVQDDELAALSAEEAGLYVEIPVWKPADGFRLMERFMTQLRNPVYKELLKDSLSSGTGVFRKFKDTLKQNSEVEKLWYQFKENGMRRVLRSWYNQHREMAGLEQLGPEPEDTEDLLLSDFIIRQGTAEDLPVLLDLDRRAFASAFPEIPAERAEEIYRRRRGDSRLLDEGGVLLVAETPEGGVAGFVWGKPAEDCAGRETLSLVQLTVADLFRGLGLGRLLAERFLAESRRLGHDRVQAALCGRGLDALSLFRALGFRSCAQTLEYRGDSS
jgi:GNAT superfamily N-acetyltransferase